MTEAATLQIPVSNSPYGAIAEQTTCLLVRFHKTGLLRKGNIDLVETKADKDQLRLRKAILTSDEYDHLMTIKRDCRRYIKKREFPSPFGEGSHLLAVGLIEEVDTKVSNAIQGYEHWADLFVAKYPELHAEQKERLKDQYTESNYYTDMGKLRSMFYVERRWFDFSPAGTQKVGDVIADREKKNTVDETKALHDKIRAAMRVGLKKLIDKLVERLTPGTDGKRKQFAATTVANVVEWLEIFSKRNICNDKDLALLADKATGILEGVDVATLKANEDIAAQVCIQLSEVDKHLGLLVQECDERALALDDDDDE